MREEKSREVGMREEKVRGEKMREEEKREELVSEDLNRSLFIIFQSLILFYSMI